MKSLWAWNIEVLVDEHGNTIRITVRKPMRAITQVIVGYDYDEEDSPI